MNKLLTPKEAASSLLKLIKKVAKGNKETERKLAEMLASSFMYMRMK